MRKRRLWLWILLFSGLAVLVGALATGWNVVLVRDYQFIASLARSLSIDDRLQISFSQLMSKMILGTLGFITVLGLAILLFVKLLNEMRLNQLQSEFIATVSHELKTPIAAIELSSSMIRAAELSPEEAQLLWNSHESELNRLRTEVDALLEAARWQSRSSVLKKKKISLEKWIELSFDQWRNLLGPTASFHREGDLLDFEILADLRTLNLILDNLLNNAKKFSRGSPHVVLRTKRFSAPGSRRKARWRLEIEDQGWGFKPSDAKKIFNRFFRSKHPAPYAIPGTGLGLYLAASATRGLGLSLTAKSKGTGMGSTFVLEGAEPR